MEGLFAATRPELVPDIEPLTSFPTALFVLPSASIPTMFLRLPFAWGLVPGARRASTWFVKTAVFTGTRLEVFKAHLDPGAAPVPVTR